MAKQPREEREQKAQAEREAKGARRKQKERYKTLAAWVLAAVGLFVIGGQALFGRRRRVGANEMTAGRALDYTLRMEQLAQAAAMAVGGDGTDVDPWQVEQVVKEIEKVEDEVKGMTGSTVYLVQDLAKQVRAQLLVVGKNRTDAELAEEGLLTYSSGEYWEKKYTAQAGEQYDWYANWDSPDPDGRTLGGVILENIPGNPKILVIGAGNSDMSSRLFNAGKSRMLSIDISASAVEQMQTKYPHLAFEAMDATKMAYADGAYEVAIDKGTIDALSAGRAPIEPLILDIARVLRTGGTFLAISHAVDLGNKITEMKVGFKCQTDIFNAKLKEKSRSNVGIHTCKKLAADGTSAKQAEL